MISVQCTVYEGGEIDLGVAGEPQDGRLPRGDGDSGEVGTEELQTPA